jgi:hypothetical protein
MDLHGVVVEEGVGTWHVAVGSVLGMKMAVVVGLIAILETCMGLEETKLNLDLKKSIYHRDQGRRETWHLAAS